jgi:uncharacterized membrane protein
MDKDQDKGMNRRDFIRKAAITGAVAWAVPVIQTVTATPAYASHVPCAHSPHGGQSEFDPSTCMGVCKAKHQTCPPGPGTGGDCQDICGAGCSQGACPSQFCNPACFQCTAGGGITFICS